MQATSKLSAAVADQEDEPRSWGLCTMQRGRCSGRVPAKGLGAKSPRSWDISAFHVMLKAFF